MNHFSWDFRQKWNYVGTGAKVIIWIPTKGEKMGRMERGLANT